MLRAIRDIAFLALVAAACPALTAAGTLAPPPAVVDPAAAHEFRQAAISPDGELVAYVEELFGPDGVPDGKSAVFVARRSLDGGWSRRRVSASSGNRDAVERDVAWAPDSRSIVFVSDGGSPGQLEIYVASAEPHAAAPRALTHVKGDMGRPQFSPDGSRLAFLWAADAPRVAGPLEPMTAPEGEIDTRIFEQRLAVIPSAGGIVDVVSPPDLYVHEFCWSPDGSRVAGVAAPGEGDANWWTARLDTFDLATHATHEIYRPADQIAHPRWSPDGRSIAFVEGLMSDEGSTGGDVFVIPSSGGPARNLTPRARFSVTWLAWEPDSNGLLICASRNGEATIDRLPADPERAGQLSEIWHGAETVKSDRGLSLSLSADQTRSAVTRSSFMAPPEVWTGPTGSWIQVTMENAGIRPAWSGAKSVSWENEGWHLQGWLLAPVNAAAKAPMVVQVHGGPASAAESSWPRAEVAGLAASGYYVFLPNPRGSFGQGEEFTKANVRDFGFGDFRDILSGVETAVGKASIDPDRIGISGWSYGGYMTMWAVTQTRRFRAAVAGAGIANWQSYYGENDIDEWMIPYFGASVYDDPDIYTRSSPMTHIKDVATPTLVLVGERDGECPAPQSFEFWHALKTAGVPTSLVVYAGEGHAFRKGSDQRDRGRRIVSWFDRYLKR